MKNLDSTKFSLQFSVSHKTLDKGKALLEKHVLKLLIVVLTLIAAVSFLYYYNNGLGLAYNDARSHLDIGRRVVEGLKPGLAQLGSVWLPLSHLLMVPTIWNDFMWHSGLSGALLSMISFVATGVLIYLFLRELKVGLLGSLVGVGLFVVNINILYLQSTAMTELLLLATMTAAAYFFLLWYKRDDNFYLLSAAFWIMLSTLVRYDGWFLFGFATILLAIFVWKRQGYNVAEGKVVLFCTLGGLGILLWLLWNLMIFKDPLYFAFGPFAAHTQQQQLEAAGVLKTKGNLLLSTKTYLYALAYNIGAYNLLLGAIGVVVLWYSKKLAPRVKYASLLLFAPFLFNVIALYTGHSVLFIQDFGQSWFNVRYGIMMMPAIAIFVGLLVHKAKALRGFLLGSLVFVSFFSFASGDSVTIDDATIGSSQKNVTEVSGWLAENARNKEGFVLISAASHDSIIFSSGLPMKKFIHEGTGRYHENALKHPDRWARWIVVRTHSDDDSTWREIKDAPGFERFELVDHYPFADIYQLRDEYLDDLIVEPILSQK